MKNSKNFGKRLAYYRKNANMTQEALALESEILQKHISEIERGVKTPTITTLERIAEALGISVAHLCSEMEAEDGYAHIVSAIINSVPNEKKQEFIEVITKIARMMD